MAFVCFLESARNGLSFDFTRDRRHTDAGSILLPLPPALLTKIKALGFLHIVYRTKIDPVLSYLAFCKTQEVDLSITADLEDPWLFYDWNTGEVKPILNALTKVETIRTSDGVSLRNEVSYGTVPEVKYRTETLSTIDTAKAEVAEFERLAAENKKSKAFDAAAISERCTKLEADLAQAEESRLAEENAKKELELRVQSLTEELEAKEIDAN